jgi:hypothetical protein
MNDPTHAVETVATVKLKKSDGTSGVADIPTDVRFTFSDPAPANTANGSSYQYDPAPKRLGKDTASGTTFWRKHTDCDIQSNDSFEKSCLVKTISASGSPDLGKAKANFLPSGRRRQLQDQGDRVRRGQNYGPEREGVECIYHLAYSRIQPHL